MPDKARRGRIRAAAEVTHELRNRLLRRYFQHKPFVNELLALEDRYRRLLRALATTRRHWNLASALNAEALWKAAQEIAHNDLFPVPDIPDHLRRGPGYSRPRQRNPHHFLKRYLDEVADLAQRWGLNAPWCPPYLHQGLVARAANLRVTDETGKPLPVVTWLGTAYTAPIAPQPRVLPPSPLTETQEEFLQRWREAGALWYRQTQALLEKAGHRRVDTRPMLERHVRWLFRRIAERKPPRIIATEESYAQAAVERAIASLARQLGVRLPRNRGPRIRR